MRIRILLVTCLWLVLVLSFSSVSFAPPSWVCENDRGFFAVGELLLWRSIGPTNENLPISKAFEKMEELNVCGLREWVWRSLIFNEDGTDLKQTVADKLNEIIIEAESYNITVMGMVQDFPTWMTGIEEYVNNQSKLIQQSVPERNLTDGSPYDIFLEKYAWSWQVLAEAFPNITVWEIGNEYNLDDFLHPENASRKFTMEEKAEITMDLLYFGSEAILSVNPTATTVLGGLGGLDDLTGIRTFLSLLYERIENATYHPYTDKTDPDYFFHVASWHPYLSNTAPNQTWIDQNEEIHGVMVDHGDNDKPVVFSELGYSDNSTGLDRTQVADFVRETFTVAKNLSWLEAIYWFRLIDPNPSFDNDYALKEYGFGLVTKDFVIKPVGEEYAIIEEFPVVVVPIILVILTASVVGLPRFLGRRKFA